MFVRRITVHAGRELIDQVLRTFAALGERLESRH